MNDEFLHRLRKEPPALFARRLQARLLMQEPETIPAVRSRILRNLVLAVLIAGSAYAGAYMAVKRIPAIGALLTAPEETPSSRSGPRVAPADEPSGNTSPDRQVEFTVDASAAAAEPPSLYAGAAPAVTARNSLGAGSSPQSAGAGSSTGRPGVSGPAVQETRAVIRIVASTPVYSMTKFAAGSSFNPTRFGRPLVDRIAAGEDLRVFCKGIGVQEPDLLATARQLTRAEADLCARNGVDRIVELKIGYRASIVVRTPMGGPVLLMPRDIFLALAKQVPDQANPTRLIDNPNRNWRQVNPQLEDQYIEAYGPGGGAQLRNDFAETIMEAGCNTFPTIAALQENDATLYNVTCHALREDGAYIETQATTDLIPQKLGASPNAIAIVSYEFYKRNEGALIGNILGGVHPNLQSIDAGSYAGSRRLYLYVKQAHVDTVPSLRRFLSEYTSERFIGPRGMLAFQGLIPMEEDDRRRSHDEASDLNELRLP